MNYQIQGYGLQYPHGYTEDVDTAVGALAAYVRVLKLCGRATVYRRVGPNTLHPIGPSELRSLADQERQRDRANLANKNPNT